MGILTHGNTNHVIPAQGAKLSSRDNSVRLAYDKATVEASPICDPKEDLGDEDERKVHAFFQGKGPDLTALPAPMARSDVSRAKARGHKTMADKSYAEEARKEVHWSSGINIIAGVWLIIAPFAWGYHHLTDALWNDIILGTAVFILAVVRTSAPLQYESVGWTNIVFGLWLIIAPFVLDYTGVNAIAAMWNDIFVGSIIAILAAISVYATHRVTRRGGPYGATSTRPRSAEEVRRTR
ncbi:SPW repeat protein [Nitrosococcus wardiae]|uniref:SPW repeat protein n=1 Tax=Nitrosococcus wardiae TaxID=1814290 RepID=UPI00141B7B06|nr:SPW repeat protein [Nitrosococcus wardiae]